MNGQRCALIQLLVVGLFWIGAPIASSQNLTNQWVEESAAPLVERRVVDGLSIGYIEGEHFGIVHLGSASQAGKKADYSTLYEIGSVSKVFTGLLLAEAVVRGEIELNAAAEVANPAGMRLPSHDGTAIKWIDLSTHRSGLPRLPGNLQPTDLKNPYRDYDSQMAAAFLNQYQLPRPPGVSQEYSNFGASVLGYLVGQKAGKSYEQLLKERIAGPLGMTDCTVAVSSDQRNRLAVPHDKVGSATVPWTFADLPGAGGIQATMRDMMRFSKAQLTPPTGTIGAAIELAWKQHRDADETGPAMGLGWIIASDGQTRWHNGQTGGSTSAVFINREQKCAVVVLCNTSIANEVDQLAMRLMLKGAGREMPAERGKGVMAIDATLRRRLVGRYQLAPNFVFDVQDRDGHLMVGITNQPTQEVYPDSPTHWSYRGVEATLEFKLTKAGPAESLVLHQNGLKQIARRISDAPGDDAGSLAIDADLRSRLVGRYQLTPDFIFTVQDRDGRLMVHITNQSTQEVHPDSPTRWSYRGVEATLEFNLPRIGRARSLILHQNGIEQTARRID